MPPTGGPRDVVSPSLLASEPDSGALGVERTRKIKLLFSETMDRASVGQNVVVGPGVRSMTPKWINGRTLELTPDDSLPANTTITLIVPPTVRDARGNAVERTYTSYFTTA